MPVVKHRVLGSAAARGARIALALVAFAALPCAAAGAAPAYLAVGIDGWGVARVDALRRDPAVAWWVELDDVLLVGGEADALTRLARERDGRLLEPTAGTELHFVGGVPSREVSATGARPLAEGGRWMVAEATRAQVAELEADHAGAHGVVRPFVPDTVLARQLANSTRRARPELALAAAPPVAAIDADRWFADVVTLAQWNRSTHGTQIASARAWLVAQFAALPGVSVTTQSFPVGSTTAYNVVATLEGTTDPDSWFLVGGHYDSTSQNTSTAAPGAEDNATGCSGVLELARVFVANPPGPTIKFLCYAGEEQGLYGSAAHASALVASGDDAHVRAMLNMDMIGFTVDADLDVLLETEPQFDYLLDVFADAAAAYTPLRLVTSLNPARSDHVPYLDRGMAAVLTIENDYDDYPHYHRTTDTPDRITTLDMGEQILRMNVAALSMLMDAECTDGDGDGYGSPGSVACTQPEPDCDDSRADVNPGATEVAGNGIDDDCDGRIDERPGGCAGIASAGSAAAAGLPFGAGFAALALWTAARRRRARD